MIKEGDILICKKYYSFITYNGDIIEYFPNHSYKVSMVLFEKKFINPGKHQKHCNISYNYIKFDGLKGNYGFKDKKFKESVKFQSVIREPAYLWDYFYTLKEYRKRKLNKIKHEK